LELELWPCPDCHPGFVYVVASVKEEADGVWIRESYKIGWSKKPLERIKSMQTGNSHRLCLVSFWGAAREVESQLHRRFSQCAIRGEWFSAKDAELDEFVRCTEREQLSIRLSDYEL
jgi:hypothetical protein